MFIMGDYKSNTTPKESHAKTFNTKEKQLRLWCYKSTSLALVLIHWKTFLISYTAKSAGERKSMIFIGQFVAKSIEHL